MARPKNERPAYLLHKPSGKARVRIDGKDYYLGEHGSPESWQAYYQLLADRCGTVAPAIEAKSGGKRITVGELALAFVQWAKDYYGPKSSQIYCIRSALRPLERGQWHRLPVDQFTPLKLQQVVEQRVLDGDCRINETTQGGALTRSTVNATLRLLKQMFRWGVSQELVSHSVYQPLTTVVGIRRGRGTLADKIKEPGKVSPAPQKYIDAALKHVGPEIAAMVRVQLLTGMRPDEVTIMRPCDISKTGAVWSYAPAEHKNDWREGSETKEVLIGPKAQKILKPFLDSCKSETDYLFCPATVMARSIERQLKRFPKRAARTIALTRTRPPRERYDDGSYRQAIRRGCDRAGVPHWSPNQLRHNAATNLRAKFGIENSQIPLGHKHTKTNEIYAEKNRKQYVEMMKQAG